MNEPEEIDLVVESDSSAETKPRKRPARKTASPRKTARKASSEADQEASGEAPQASPERQEETPARNTDSAPNPLPSDSARDTSLSGIEPQAEEEASPRRPASRRNRGTRRSTGASEGDGQAAPEDFEAFAGRAERVESQTVPSALPVIPEEVVSAREAASEPLYIAEPDSAPASQASVSERETDSDARGASDASVQSGSAEGQQEAQRTEASGSSREGRDPSGRPDRQGRNDRFRERREGDNREGRENRDNRNRDGRDNRDNRNRPQAQNPNPNANRNKGPQGNPNRQGGGGPQQQSVGNNPQQQPRQQQAGQPQNPHGKQKIKQKNKPNWQNNFAAAEEDDFDEPSFEKTLAWEVMVSETSLNEYIAGHFDTAAEPLDYNTLYGMPAGDLNRKASAMGVTESTSNRSRVLRSVLSKALENRTPVYARGIVEVAENGYGFVVFSSDNYRLRTDSPFLAPTMVSRNALLRGHEVEVLLRSPLDASETCPVVLRIQSIMGQSPADVRKCVPFKELTAYYPNERIVLESVEGDLGKWDNISMRVVDLLSPIGLGQRGLIVAPPRTGKTVLMQGIANSIRVNKPDARLIILLVDERPEEVTDFKRTVKGAEVIASTFDESAESHVHAAEMVIEKARRLVESGQHVIILLDSITRLARAYNALAPNSGKILSGGVEASALQKPKRFFGSARNIEGGGSLTILGTALVDTGSKMDEVIFEEFKGTGNMELHLDRDLSNKRVFPALSFEKSGTRKEEILYHPDEMTKVHALRRAMKGVPSTEAMEMLIQRVKKTPTNAAFLMGIGR